MPAWRVLCWKIVICPAAASTWWNVEASPLLGPSLNEAAADEELASAGAIDPATNRAAAIVVMPIRCMPTPVMACSRVR